MGKELADQREKTRLIYLVDDDEEDVVLFQMAAQVSCPADRIRIFPSGLELLRFFECNIRELPDVMFINNNMPILNGIQTLTELRKFPEVRPVPKIFISGVVLENHIEQARRAGAVACLVKPHSVAELVALLTHSQGMWGD
ncbi:hypothetical protein GCM10027347_07090 [Larkinella harenae]